jgi:hypothetical protein
MHRKLDGLSLVDEYMLRKERERNGSDEGPALDELYRRIKGRPIRNIADAIEKRRFAHYCLVEEGDIKEAADLLLQVCAAMATLADQGDNDAAAR